MQTIELSARDHRARLVWGALTTAILLTVGVAPWLRFLGTGW
jgi:hypothetical protein